jgi:hypothetical protein
VHSLGNQALVHLVDAYDFPAKLLNSGEQIIQDISMNDVAWMQCGSSGFHDTMQTEYDSSTPVKITENLIQPQTVC